MTDDLGEVQIAGVRDAQSQSRRAVGEKYEVENIYYPNLKGSETEEGLLERVVDTQEDIAKFRSKRQSGEPPDSLVVGQTEDNEGKRLSLTYGMLKQMESEAKGILQAKFGLKGAELSKRVDQKRLETQMPPRRVVVTKKPDQPE